MQACPLGSLLAEIKTKISIVVLYTNDFFMSIPDIIALIPYNFPPY